MTTHPNTQNFPPPYRQAHKKLLRLERRREPSSVWFSQTRVDNHLLCRNDHPFRISTEVMAWRSWQIDW